jgi:hypothetical protein
MGEGSNVEGRPLGYSVKLAVTAVTALSFFAWLLIGLGAMLNSNLADGWIYIGLALPGAAFGAIAAQARGRRSYLLIGFAVTLIPLVACVVMNVVTPPPPHPWTGF